MSSKRGRPRLSPGEKSIAAKRWVFTRFFKDNEDENEIYEQLCKKFDKWEKCNRAIFQLEQTTSLHIQGACTFKDNVTKNTLQKFIGHKPHVEVMRGDWNSQKYCGKEDTKIRGPFTKGKKPRPGHRSDWEALKTLCKEPGTTIEDIEENHFNLLAKHESFIKRYLRKQQLGPPKPQALTPVYVYHGPGGTGKSTAVQNYCIENKLSLHVQWDPKWWDGYCGQQVIELAEFDPTEWTTARFKRLIDINEDKWLPIKGSFVRLENVAFFITTNMHPNNWGMEWQAHSIKRRLTEIKEFTDRYSES